MKIHIIINPKAGSFRQSEIDDTLEILKQKGIECQQYITEHKDHAEQIAQDLICKKDDIIIVCGGDGTLCEVINGLHHKDLHVGIIPMGTVNVVAKFYKILANAKQTSRIISKNKFIESYLGKVSGKYFVFSSSIGADSYALEHVNLNYKKYIGKFAYLLSFFKGMRKFNRPNISVAIDDEKPFSCFGIIVGKMKVYAGQFTLFENAHPDNEKYQICYFKKGGALFLFLGFLMILTGMAKKCPWLIFKEAKEIKVTTDRPYKIQIDGNIYGETPAIFTPETEKIHLLVP